MISFFDRLLDKKSKHPTAGSCATSLMSDVVEIRHRDDLSAGRSKWRNVAKRMNQIRFFPLKLKWEHRLLPSITDDAAKCDEWTHYSAEIRRGRHIEVRAAFVDENNVLVVGIRFGESIDQRDRVRLGPSYNARNQVEKIESDDQSLNRRNRLRAR
jgi:hypothetical protein